MGLSGSLGVEELRALCREEDPHGHQIVAPKLTRDSCGCALMPGGRIHSPGRCGSWRLATCSGSGSPLWSGVPVGGGGLLERQSQEGVRLTAGQKADVFSELIEPWPCAVGGGPGDGLDLDAQDHQALGGGAAPFRARTSLGEPLLYRGPPARSPWAAERPASGLEVFKNGNPASKFALQRAHREPAMAEVARERVPISKGDGRQVVLRVDKAGFLGARQAERLPGGHQFSGGKVRRSCGR